MTLTLSGRIQTRLVLLLVVGVPWTALVSPFLPVPGRAPVLSVYSVTFLTLGVVLVLGLLWDAIYYWLEQLRWDRDWPSSFALLNGLNEGATTWVALQFITNRWHALAPIQVDFATFAIHFGTVWVLLWLTAQGPLRIFALRWRFNGGRLF